MLVKSRDAFASLLVAMHNYGAIISKSIITD